MRKERKRVEAVRKRKRSGAVENVHMPRSKVELKDTGSKNLEQFQDQVDCSCALFAVDNYFKNKSKNRSKNLDWKSGENFKICDRNDALKCDLDNLQHCLANIDNFLPDQMKKDCLKISEDFEKWFSYLAAGFNLLMYGVGSKNSLMKEFCNDQLGECTFLTVNGFMPSVNAWTILKALYLHLSLKIPSKGNGFMGFVKGISGELERRNEDVVLVINNIDGPGLRSDLDKRALVHLARCSKIHIVASANLFNSSVLWNQTMCVGLNFLWINVNTWKCYREEFTALESRLLGHRSDHSGSSHTIDTLNAIWRSLTTNSQMILHLIAKYFYSTGMPLEFFDLFRRARDEFFVSAETALRYQLNEFYDHRLIDRYQHRDGIVYISMIVDKKVMIEFFNGIGVKMDQEQLSE